MTTASVQKRTQQPSSVQDRPSQPSEAGPQIPVLIRLPDLGTSTITIGAGSQVDPIQASSSSSSHVASAGGSAAGEPSTTDQSDGSPTPLPMKASKPGEREPWWTDFRIPSSVVHAAVALALIAIFIAAYMAIVGGGNDKHKQEIAADQSAAEKQTTAGTQAGKAGGPDSIAQDSLPTALETPKQIASSAAGSVKQPAGRPSGTATRQPSAGQTAGAAQQAAVQPKQPPTEGKPSDPAEKQMAGTPEQPSAKPESVTTDENAIVADQTDPNIQQTEFASSADTSTEQSAGGTPAEAPAIERPASFRNENPPIQDFPANDVAAGGPAERPAETRVAPSPENQPTDWPSMYPVTNPASYQYPADYHERLLSPNGVEGAQPDSSWSAGAPRPGQRPSTARLQPRIEPPPLR